MIVRFQRSIGLRIFRFGSTQGELWFCPRAEALPEHVHPRMESLIVFLGGRMFFTRSGRTILLGLNRLFSAFKVKSGEPHSAVVTGRFGLFLNIERWTDSPTSAAHDFIRI